MSRRKQPKGYRPRTAAMKHWAGETIRKVKRTISKYQMVKHGERVVVAVSGGADSVCLLDILNNVRHELGVELIVAHFNHGFRPGEDEQETQFVHALATKLGLMFEKKKGKLVNVPRKGSLEARAREARYEFLEEVRQKHLAQKIAVGHHLNDQAETILLRLLRGTGPTGLAGMSPVRDGIIIRPLIETTRAEIEFYVQRKGLSYMTDSSNLQPRFLRNRIRLELLPQLERIQPRIVKLLGQLRGFSVMDENYMESQANDWVVQQVGREDSQTVKIPLGPFRTLPAALRGRVIRRSIEVLRGNLQGIHGAQIEAIRRMVLGNRPQAQVNLPGGMVARKIYDNLVLTLSREAGLGEYSYVIEGLGTYDLKAPGFVLGLEEMEARHPSDLRTSLETAYLSEERIRFPLTVRNFQPGDWFVPFGMKGRKKIKDFFIDLKIPFQERRKIPILLQGSTVVWVCGLRMDDRFKVTSKTGRIVRGSISYTSPFARRTKDPRVEN